MSKEVEAQPVALGGQPGFHVLGAVRGQAVPDQDHRLAAQVATQLGEVLDEAFGVVAARFGLEDQLGSAAVGAVGQYAGPRHARPGEPVGQHRCLATRRPGAPHDGQQRESTFVLETDPRACASSPLLIRGQSFLTHASMAASSRSLARRAGRCRVQPRRWRRISQVCDGEYRTPVTCSMTCAIRARVHMSVANPWAFGPANSAACTSASCCSDSRAVRPSRWAPTSASRPPVRQLWYQRDAACADTPNWVTTSTCRMPASNNSTARIRRSRNAFTSRQTLWRGPDARVGVGMTMIVLPANGNDRQRLTQNTKDLLMRTRMVASDFRPRCA